MEIYSAPPELTGFSHRYLTASQPMVLHDASGQQHVVKFAEKVEYGSLGLSREYLGGTFAEVIGAAVPTTTFVELTANSLVLDQNIVFDDGSRPVPQITVGSSYNRRLRKSGYTTDVRSDAGGRCSRDLRLQHLGGCG